MNERQETLPRAHLVSQSRPINVTPSLPNQHHVLHSTSHPSVSTRNTNTTQFHHPQFFSQIFSSVPLTPQAHARVHLLFVHNMGDKPRLPPVSTLLKMTEMDNDYSAVHRSDRRAHRASNNFDGSHLSASFSHHRGRSSASSMEIDHPISISSRSRRQEHPIRSSASAARPTTHSHRGGNLLPSVSEVLGPAHDSRSSQWPHPSSLAHDRSNASGSRTGQAPPPVVPGPSAGQGGHPCERCGRMFTRKSDAVKHKRVVHDKVKTYTCRECGRKFARKDYCTVCLKTFFLPLSST